MDSGSLLTSLSTSLTVFAVLMLLYTRIATKPDNVVMYYSNRILKGRDPWEGYGPSSRPRNPFSWIKEAFSTQESDMIAISGVDTAVYFVFLSTVLGILVLSGLILLPMLLPVAANDSGISNSSSGIDKYSIGHVKAKSSRLWAFVVAVYWVSLVSYYLLWKACKHVSDLRAFALMEGDPDYRQFAILVRDIPPLPAGFNNRKEQMNKIWEELQGLGKKLRSAEHVYHKSKTNAKPEGTRPTTRTGLFGLIGRKASCSGCSAEPTLPEGRQVDGHGSSRALPDHLEQPRPQLLREADPPSCRVRHSCTHNLVLHDPAGVHLVKVVPFLKPVVEIKALRTVLEAYLPQLALFVFLAVLPKLLMYLSVLEGIPSTSHAVRATSGKYFYFTVFNVFIGVMIGGTVFSMLKTIEEDPHRTVGIFAANLSDNATVFLNYVALKFLVGYGLELSRLVPLILYHLKKKYICKTEEDLRDAWAPGDLGYETRFPGDMLIATIVLCYSVIAPLILPFGIAYFALGWLILRNQALKVYIPSFESYGRMWPHIHTRLIGALLLFQVTMVGYSGVKEFYYTPVLILPPAITLVFAFVCKNKFYRSFKCPALDSAAWHLRLDPDMEQIVQHFIPPGLKSRDKPDEGAFSRSSV